eukprot:TRINITY_DN60182_c0_g1_i1.p1 TRINITY_DN60182_c0_g1~~TRINITY_DN60182_c0_g1_i1.p1  ORF type:complete len:459 (+),score=71.53 TRINITY_DN60182_c0_g1_i1:64-1440(+)
MFLCSLLIFCGSLVADGALAPSRRPPMGWRSWNSLFLDISQDKILAQAQALAAVPEGGGASLKELGYKSVGVDDGWQACGEGVNGSFHDDKGVPLLNLTRFPDLQDMVKQIHTMGLEVGWYFNNCWCQLPELYTWLSKGGNTAQDVDFLVKYGMDGVKVDGCGPSHNITLWSELITKAPAEIELENCADNGLFAWETAYTPADQPGWVPATPADVVHGGFNSYRVSVDIAPQFYSAMHNLQLMEPFLTLDHPLSRPGTWAYPDILQVANKNPVGVGEMTPVEWRTHFAAWCITSSPLILGFDLTNKEVYKAAYPIVANRRAIEINQLWAGHPGRLVQASATTFRAVAGKHANDECENGDPSMCEHVVFPTWQLWSKPLPSPYPGWQAVLLINLQDSRSNLSFSLADLSIGVDQVEAIDVWSGEKVHIVDTFSKTLDGHASCFLMIPPTTEAKNSADYI